MLVFLPLINNDFTIGRCFLLLSILAVVSSNMKNILRFLSGLFSSVFWYMLFISLKFSIAILITSALCGSLGYK